MPSHLELMAHSLLQLKSNPNFPSHHKRRPVSLIESRVEPRGSCCKEKGCRVSPQLQISPDSPAPAPMGHRVSPHNRMGGLSALPILLKKPKSPPELHQRPDIPLTTQAECRVPPLNTRRGLIHLLNLDRKPEIPVAAGEEH